MKGGETWTEVVTELLDGLGLGWAPTTEQKVWTGPWMVGTTWTVTRALALRGEGAKVCGDIVSGLETGP